MAEIHDVLQGYIAIHIVRSIVIRTHSRAVEAATAIKLATNIIEERSLLIFT